MSSKKGKKNNRKNNQRSNNNAPKNQNKAAAPEKAAENIIDIDENEFKNIFDFDPDADNTSLETAPQETAEPVKEVPSKPEKTESEKTDAPMEISLSKPQKPADVKQPVRPSAAPKPAETEKKSETPAPKPAVQETAPQPVKAAEAEQDNSLPPITRPAPTPPPQKAVIRKEVTAEQQDALDKLEQDLAKAQYKKERENQRAEQKRQEEARIEAERMEKAKAVQEKANRAAERSAQIEKEKQLKKNNTPAKPKEVTPVKKERDPMLGMNILKGAVVLLVVAGIAYAGGMMYTKTLNDSFIQSMEKELMGIAAAGASDENDTIITDGALTNEQKEELGLTLYLPDTDKDGLSDHYELNVSDTDPKNPDTDDDNISDGAELYSGTDPKTADDSSAAVTNVISVEGASVEIVGKPQNALASIDRVTNNSILGASGVVGSAYEFYTASAMQSCRITIEYKNEDLQTWATNPLDLAIFKFNSETLSFDKLESTPDPASCSVSADIDSIGIYAIGDTNYMQEEYNTRIFFLIDNSGSMYPEEQCPNSEENDVEFKRLDFACNLIDKLGTNAEYGAAQFTGTYTKISDITADTESVKLGISNIRNLETYFDGTEIAQSIINAVDEMGKNKTDKNYIVLLTDGYPSSVNPVREAEAVKKAVDNNVTIFTIGLGKRIDADYLSNIAAATNGQFFQVSNASALDRICGKIDSFMSFNKTTVSLSVDENTQSTDVYILADSGFNVDKDSMSYNNFRADFSETGTDYGIAELTRQYFTGELKLSAKGYTADDGREITGYDLNSVAQLVDGKPDLVDLKIGFLDTYNEYLALENKWDYGKSKDGMLKYTTDTIDFINAHDMTTIVQPYTVKLPEVESWIEMLQKITFQRLPEFSSFECAVVNSILHDGSDKDMLNAFNYMQNLHNSEQKCTVYDFGYHGDEAFDILLEELTRGNPVVISLDGSALNAVRLLRESENTNKLVLETYNCNNMGKTTYVSLLRTPVYDGEKTPYYQYSASVDGQEMSLKMYITK